MKKKTTAKESRFVGKSKTINKDKRNVLLKSLIANTFEKEYDNLRKKKTKFGDALYEEFIQPCIKHIKQLPSYYHTKQNYIQINLGTTWNDYRNFPLSKNQLFLSNYSDVAPHLLINEFKTIHTQAEILVQIQDKITEKREQLYTKTKAALEACRTTKQLFEVWPEGYAEFIEIFPEEATVHLPTIPRIELNKQLGL